MPVDHHQQLGSLRPRNVKTAVGRRRRNSCNDRAIEVRGTLSRGKQTRSTGSLRGQKKVICEREKALYEAFKAACALLGPRSAELHAPSERVAERKFFVEKPLAEDPIDEEEKVMLAKERELENKVRRLESQLENIQRQTRMTERQKDLEIKDRDRVLFNARCGLELMTELADDARRVEMAKMRARAQKMEKRRLDRPKKAPEFIQMINDVSVDHLVQSAASSARRRRCRRNTL